jgi:hypothetical protein
MARHSYVSSLPDLEKWFLLLGKPQWNLYRGHHENMARASTVYRQKEDSMDMAESWELLRDMISINSSDGGQFTVFVPNSATGGAGTSTLVAINMESVTPTSRGVAIAGVPSGMVSLGQVQEEIAKERRMWELEREIQDLRNAQESGLGITDVIKQQLATMDLSAVISGIIQHFTARATMPGVQLQGTPSDMVPPPPAADPAGYAYDGKQLKPILDHIRPHFATDADFYGFLEAVAVAFVQNPNLFKTNFGYA